MMFGVLLNRLLPDSLQNMMAPLYGVIKHNRRYEKYWQWFDSTDEWSREKLLDFQWAAMKRLLKHAYENVPYYRERWKEKHISIDDICEYSDLVNIPLLTKSELREHSQDLIVKNVDTSKLIVHQTGGTTGKPLKFYYDIATDKARYASMRRWEKYAGMSSRSSSLIYMGRPSFKLINDKNNWGEFGEAFHGNYFPLARKGSFASTNLTETVMLKYCELLEKYEPSFLKGYSSGLNLLAEYCVRTKRNYGFIKAVMASSDAVTQKQRDLTRRAWNCEVYDRYGMGEEIATAAECCEHNGYHLDMVKCLVEVVDDAGKQIYDNSGRLIGTNLTNTAMPLIRYEVGDCASLSQRYCICGKQSMMLSSFEGRTSDIITTPAGKKLSAGVLNQLAMGIAGVLEFQLVLVNAATLKVRVVADGKTPIVDENIFLKRISSQLDETMNVQIEYTERIQRKKNGKFQLVISEVSH